jgi:inorganic phosphate transporter, PiT family
MIPAGWGGGWAGVDAAFVLAVVAILAFAFTNGFHDAANAIATLVATRGARPGAAILLAAVCNLLGPLLLGAAVADTIAGIVEVTAAQTVVVVGAALTAAVVWNLVTWWRGLPSSSSHALVGGLVGAAVVEAGGGAVNWGGVGGGHPEGVVGALVALAISPVLGFGAAWAMERGVRRGLRRVTTRANRPVRRAQWLTSGWLAISHGANDAQKAVGVLAVLLLANGTTQSLSAPVWATLACAGALTVGTALGGWRIVKTIGRRIFRIRPVDGLVSQTSSAAVILVASLVGAPASTTQVVSSSVVGVGVGRRRYRHVGWGVVGSILLAWVTTFPAAAVLAALLVPVWRWLP